jgi:hypothetical protein
MRVLSFIAWSLSIDESPRQFILLGSLNTDESPKFYCLVLSIDLLIESPDANDIG